jgi:hypothetical protein
VADFDDAPMVKRRRYVRAQRSDLREEGAQLQSQDGPVHTTHDDSPWVTIHCDCGYESRLHESRLGVLAPFEGVLQICQGCRDVLQFSAGELASLRKSEKQP